MYLYNKIINIYIYLYIVLLNQYKKEIKKMRYFLRMELLDDLRRTHKPNNKNNSRACGTGCSDKKSVMGSKFT